MAGRLSRWAARVFGAGSDATFPPLPWVATHRHKKGGLYRRIGNATLEADRSPVVIYDDEQGTVWVRSLVEFEDGRFTPVGPKTI